MKIIKTKCNQDENWAHKSYRAKKSERLMRM